MYFDATKPFHVKESVMVQEYAQEYAQKQLRNRNIEQSLHLKNNLGYSVEVIALVMNETPDAIIRMLSENKAM